MLRISTDYEIIAKVGSGAFSSVYKAKRKYDDLIVAIKIIEAQTEDDVQTIITEGNVLMHLNGGHPSIPKIYDSFNDGIMFYIIMEYLDGFITLLDWLIPFTPMIINGKYIKDDLHTKERDEEISYLFNQIISSVNFLYQKFVIHRDLKLENIMINPKTKAIKIVDFGLSVISKSMSWSNICGSLEYMAPEIIQDIIKDQNGNFYQKTESSLYTTQSEVWSLGIILYGMIYCRLPFYNSRKFRLITLISNINVPYEPEELITNQNMKNLLKSMLTKDPSERISFKQVLNHPFLKNQIGNQEKFCYKSCSIKEEIEKIIAKDDFTITSKSDFKILDEKSFDEEKCNIKSIENTTKSIDSLPLSFMSNNPQKAQKPWQNIDPRPIKNKFFTSKLI